MVNIILCSPPECCCSECRQSPAITLSHHCHHWVSSKPFSAEELISSLESHFNKTELSTIHLFENSGGLIGFMRRYVPHQSQLASALTRITQLHDLKRSTRQDSMSGCPSGPSKTAALAYQLGSPFGRPDEKPDHVKLLQLLTPNAGRRAHRVDCRLQLQASSPRTDAYIHPATTVESTLQVLA